MKKNKYMYILNIFLFYSIFGNFFERFAMYYIDRSYVSGFMGTIFTPIYGIAMLIVLYIHNRLSNIKGFIKIIFEFFTYMIILTFLEFLGGVMIENIFNKVFWNYDKFKYNLGLYVSLETSLIWGFLSIITLYFVHPLFIRLENKIPKWLSVIVGLSFIVNLIISLVN